MCRHHRLAACSAPSAFATPLAPTHEAPDLGLEPRHLTLRLDFDLDRARLVGTAHHRLVARRDGVSSVVFDAVDLTIHEVRVGGIVTRTGYDGTRLRVPVPATVRGDEVSVEVDYEVVEPETGLIFSRPDDDVPERPRFAATDSESERARHWMPCIDHPSARPTLRFEILADDRATVLANGALLDAIEEGEGRSRRIFVLDHPCPSYLTCVAVGEFITWRPADPRGRDIAAFTTRAFDPAHLERSFGRTGEMLDWMERFLDLPFPWPKYHQFAVPGIGGAMENISLVSWDDRFLLDGPLATEWQRLVDQVNVHEMAHTWFGDLVVCRDFAHVWLKESWATFMEQVWFEEQVSAEEGEWEWLQNARSYFDECDRRYRRPIVTRVFDHSWQMFDMHLYPGGACRLHMLRALLGADTFWAAVRDYLRTWQGRTVETDDFRRVLEAHSGRSLTTFFDRFFHRPGFPELTVRFTWDEGTRMGRLVVSQTQVELGQNQPPFPLETAVAWRIGGTTHRATLTIREATTVLTLPMEEAPAWVRVDPDRALLARVTYEVGEPMMRALMEGAPDLTGRIVAAEHVAERGTREGIDAVADRLAAEGFWGARVAMAVALVRAPTSGGAARAAAWVAHERDARVIDAIARAAMDVAEHDALLRALEAAAERGLPPRAHAAVLAVRARHGRIEKAALLEHLDDRDAFQGIVPAGAADGLARLRTDKAIGALTKRAAPGRVAERARPWLLQALGRAVPFAEHRAVREDAIDALTAVLDEGPSAARDAAIVALGATENAAAIPALERARPRTPAQFRPALDARIAGLRSANASTSSAAERIEALEKTARDLRERLDELASLTQALREANSSRD